MTASNPGSLLYIGHLCDDDCVALFTKYDVKIYKNGQVIIVGERNATNGLWNTPLAPKTVLVLQPHHSGNGAIKNVRTKRDLVAFPHICAFSPLPFSVIQAIQRGHFSLWPGLTTTLITKDLPKSPATSKGHLGMEQKNIQSTKIATTGLDLATSLDIIPSQEPNNPQTNVVLAAILTEAELRKSYLDHTGKFPVQSSCGYNYVMIIYDYDSNIILSKPRPGPVYTPNSN